jgi:RNA polymerase sigma factor (sigma-70 family)
MSPGLSTRLLATQSDERLVALVRDGHERAFEALVLRYRRPLLSYCRRLALPEARVEDVLQQALLKTWIALRGGAEVRDIKAWLYRVVHNTAVNAARDAARERERLSDPTLRVGAAPGDLERGLVMREALAEVAALPELQREVIVRTAVGGDSHEQVASELGISDGAVRGLLYRARATLRTAVTALTPPPLLGWMAGRVQPGPAPAPETLAGLAAGGGGAVGLGGLGGSLGGGLGGLLVKGGVVAVTAGTLITGAVVHLQGGQHPPSSPKLTAVASVPSTATSSGVRSPAQSTAAALRPRGTPRVLGSRPGGRRALDTAGAGRAGAPSATAVARERPAVAVTSPSGDAPAPREVSAGAPSSGVAPSPQPAAPNSGGGGQSESSSQSDPVGSAAGSGSSGAAGSEGTQGAASTPPAGGGSSGQAGSGGTEQSGSASPEGSGSSGSGGSGSGGSGTSGSSGSASGSGSGQSEGGLVGAVVHEVGSLLEHVLH